MHSSRMRTARSLPNRGGGGVSVQGGLCLGWGLQGFLSRGSLSGGGSAKGGVSVREGPLDRDLIGRNMWADRHLWNKNTFQ